MSGFTVGVIYEQVEYRVQCRVESRVECRVECSAYFTVVDLALTTAHRKGARQKYLPFYCIIFRRHFEILQRYTSLEYRRRDNLCSF